MFKVNNENIRTMALTKKGTDIRRKTEGHENMGCGLLELVKKM